MFRLATSVNWEHSNKSMKKLHLPFVEGVARHNAQIFFLFTDVKKYLFDFSRILLTSITSQNIMDLIEMVPRWYPHTEVHGDGVLDVHGYRRYSWKIKNSILSPYSIVQAAECKCIDWTKNYFFVDWPVAWSCWLCSQDNGLCCASIPRDSL